MLDRIVRRCLAKDPDERWQSASDLKRDLQWVVEAPSGAIGSHAVAVWKGHLTWAWMALAGAVLLLTLGFAGMVYFRRPPAESLVMRFVISPPEGLTLNGFSVSPDGRRVGFIASGSDRSVPSAIWVRPIDAVTAQPLPGTEGATSLFWSPDSRFIAFFTRFSKLKKIDLSGGGPITLCCDAKIFVGVMPGTWNRDGL